MKRIRSLVRVFLCCGLMFVVSMPLIAAPLTIEITQGIEDALPIAVVPFASEGKRKSPVDIAKIISDDLRLSGRFKPFPVSDMLSKPTDPKKIKFQNWRVLGVENLVIGKVRYLGADRYEVNFWLFDIFKAKQLPSFRVPGSESSMRATAHKISDVIYEELFGEPGAFSTSIAYVTAKYNGKETQYTLWMSDLDGHNESAILRSKEPIMSPAWSPDGDRIAYASLEFGGKQRIIIQDWSSRRREIVNIGRPGLFGAPSWSPDGKKLAFTITYNGNAEINVLDLGSKKVRQLTRHWAIDTEAVWMPDGKSIIFTSGRGGRPQLYKMSADGGKVKRLTFEGEENARAAISSDGRMMAMVHRNNGNYQIAVMELATGNLSILTDGTLDESPSFAPNGSMIIYATTKKDRAELEIVSVDGRVRLPVKTDVDIREPAWSPLNK